MALISKHFAKVEDLEFLSNLDTRLNTKPVPYQVLRKNMKFYGEVHKPNSEYATTRYVNPESRMFSFEVKQLLELVDGKNYILSPVSTGLSSPGFVLVNNAKESLLYFTEWQLPIDYDFHKLSKNFMKEENVKSAKKLDIIILNNRRKYQTI